MFNKIQNNFIDFHFSKNFKSNENSFCKIQFSKAKFFILIKLYFFYIYHIVRIY